MVHGAVPDAVPDLQRPLRFIGGLQVAAQAFEQIAGHGSIDERPSVPSQRVSHRVIC
jgi:hypothetical protein